MYVTVKVYILANVYIFKPNSVASDPLLLAHRSFTGVSLTLVQRGMLPPVILAPCIVHILTKREL